MNAYIRAERECVGRPISNSVVRSRDCGSECYLLTTAIAIFDQLHRLHDVSACD